MTTPGASNVEALDTLAAVARLLGHAADTAWARADAEPLSVFAGFAHAADSATSRVLHLLPEDFDLDGPEPVETDFRSLLLAAEELTRAHPIETFPAGTTQLLVAISDLIGETAP